MEILAILREILGEHAPSYATIKNWVAQFKHGVFSTFFVLAGLRTYQHPGICDYDNTSSDFFTFNSKRIPTTEQNIIPQIQSVRKHSYVHTL
jgi:hypothetical protein